MEELLGFESFVSLSYSFTKPRYIYGILLFAITRLRRLFSLRPLYHIYALFIIVAKQRKQMVSSTLSCTGDRVAEDKQDYTEFTCSIKLKIPGNQKFETAI